MSNPSQNKGPVSKWEQPIEDKSTLHGTDQQTQDRLHDDIYNGRNEQQKPVEEKKTVAPTETEKPSSIMLVGHVQKDHHLSRREENELRKMKEEKLKTSYPKAQPSYDASGNLNHIDIMPDKDRYEKNRR